MGSAPTALTRANYISNKLPGAPDNEYACLAIGCFLTTRAIRDDAANNIDVVAIANQLRAAVLEFYEKANGNLTFVRPLADFMDFKLLQFAPRQSYTAGAPTQANTLLQLSSKLFRLDEQVVLAPHTPFDVRVRIEDPTVLPSAANWAASGQDPLHLRCAIQYTRSDASA